MENKIELGDEVIDTITGFKGVAVGKTTWLYGCNRIAVQPKVGKDGKLGETASFDEPQLKVTKKKVSKEKIDRVKGGPRPEMKQKEVTRQL